MSQYQIIAKKYRPKSFQDVYEQDAIIATLKNAIRYDRVGHAYLFAGSRGTGKTTLARLFAKAINCQNRSEEGEPCNACPSCHEINLGNSLDVIEIDAASNRGIDDIRNLNETTLYAPSAAGHKVYIVDEVHMLTKEAFNALLKTLEEPPAHVIFCFATTEPHKVLPTILSRCQRFDLQRISTQKTVAKLQAISKDLDVEVESGAFALIASYAEGSLRDAESMLDRMLCFGTQTVSKEQVQEVLGLVPQDTFFELDKAAVSSNFLYAFELAGQVFNGGVHLTYFLDCLMGHYRQIALVQLGAGEELKQEESHEFVAAYTKAAKLYTKEQVLTILDHLMVALESVQKSPFKRVNLEVLLLRIIRSMKQMTPDKLVEELVALKSQIKTGSSVTAPTKQQAPVIAKLPESKKEAPKEEPTPPPKVETPPISSSAPSTESTHDMQLKKKIKHERILRFAEVELNGNLSK